MKRSDFNKLVAPLSEKLYRFAFTLVPDDLQAEQLVIDSFNAYLLKEKKRILANEIDLNSNKNLQVQRRQHLRSILRYIFEIGVRRSIQLSEQLKLSRPNEYAIYFSLEPKTRFVMSLRFDAQFSMEEIEEIVHAPRYEVIEKIHNGRFLLLSDLSKGVQL